CSGAPIPALVVAAAQAREVFADFGLAARAAQLQQRTLQPRQVAHAPAGGRNMHAAAVEIDQPPLAGGVIKDVVGVEVGVIEAFAMEASQQAPGLLPRR